MIPAIKAEFRKLLSVRSTYFFLLLCIVPELIFALYVDGLKIKPEQLHNHGLLISEVTSAASLIPVILALVGILLMTHEYRYNTILYTLSSARRRGQILLAKFLVVSVFALIFTAVFAALAPLLAWIGIHIGHHTLIHQDAPSMMLVLRVLFVGWGFSMLGLIIAVLVRSQVAAIVAVFLIPSTIESLLSLLLKHNQVYLPYTSVGAVLQHPEMGVMSYGRAAVVASLWIVGGWIVAAVFFQRRDAN